MAKRKRRTTNNRIGVPTMAEGSNRKGNEDRPIEKLSFEAIGVAKTPIRSKWTVNLSTGAYEVFALFYTPLNHYKCSYDMFPTCMN